MNAPKIMHLQSKIIVAASPENRHGEVSLLLGSAVSMDLQDLWKESPPVSSQMTGSSLAEDARELCYLDQGFYAWSVNVV
jgi:hypothetical protein